MPLTMRRKLTWFALIFACAGPALAAPPKAPPAAAAPKKTAQKVDLKALAAVLEGSNERAIIDALAELEAKGADAVAAAPLVNGVLVRGSSVAVTLSALNCLGALGAESSSDAISPYVQHRRPEIRQAAAAALVRTRGPVAVRALRKGLKSPDPVVRESAARGLGALGASDAVEELFVALGDEVPGASRSIAGLCNPEQCDRLMGYVGKLKFETLEPCFVPLILRPSGLPEQNKIRYIDRLRRMATKSAGSVLQTALASLPADGSPKIREALETALKGRPVAGDQGGSK
jgi:HEAT repeat protein